jgi:hypothetical protein
VLDLIFKLENTPTEVKFQLPRKKTSLQYLGLAIFAGVASIVMSYFSYFQPAFSPFNAYQAVSCIVFWGAVLTVVFAYPLRGAFSDFAKYIKTARGIAIYVTYTAIHLLVYGIILEAIVAMIYPAFWGAPVQSGVILSSQPLYPLSALTLAGNLFFNPNIAALVPPIFDISISLYSIAMAVMIGVLVQANIMRTIELRNACSFGRRSTTFFVLPLIGVVGGASCCLSLPLFVTLLAAPSVSLASPSIITAYFLSYLLFPAATAAALKLNLDSVSAIVNKLSIKTR